MNKSKLKYFRIGKNKRNQAIVLVTCFCRKKFKTLEYNIKNGHTQSCGCIRNWDKRIHLESCPKNITAEYNCWNNIKKRCFYSKAINYQNYGGRGITVYSKWLLPNGIGYFNFLKDLGRKPGPEYSIDRINVNGNYEPKNCRWTTAKIQANNRRKKIIVTEEGKDK